jgi:signal recognition particle receptor subunit beta
MATFDLAQQRVCVRVVYDGAASAGKTTNLRQLAEIFATQRTCELFSPAEMEGRTLYFDWLQIAAGMVCGFPLVVQIITVPGQVVLTARRRHLLRTADVVVHVVDSVEHAVERARDGLALFDDVVHERGLSVPLVVQANKQDQPGAVSGAALLATLGRSSVPMVEAIASEGIGVVDTFVAAVRGAVRALQARVEAGDVRVPVASAETAETALGRLEAEAVDPDWALEMMLEEASNAFAMLDGVGDREEGEDEDDDEAQPDTWRPDRPDATRAAFPTEHVPTGFVWPAHTGREALRALGHDERLRAPVALDHDGAVHVVVGDFVLATGKDRRYDSSESARQALVRAARDRAQLGALLAPETVLVVQPTREASWLWTILPRLPTVAELVASHDRGEPRTTLLAAFGSALGAALKLQVSQGIALDLAPQSFGVRHGALRYVGDVASIDGHARDVGKSLVDAFESLEALGAELEPAVLALETALAAKLSPDEATRLAHACASRDVTSLSVTIGGAWSRVRRALRRDGQAA